MKGLADMKHIIQLFPTLILSQEVFSVLVSATAVEKREISEAFAYLDAFGLNKSFMGRRCKRNGGNWELFVRFNAETAVEFTLKRVEEGPYKFEITTPVWR
ncbi:hypothetical protein MHH60_20415 [Paenibacillus sp. FSL H7-0716]